MALSVIERLRRAAREGSLAELSALCQLVDTRSKDHHGLNALMHAARGGQLECAQHLLDQSDMAARSKDGKTALMHAAQTGSEACCALLLGACDPLAVDRNNRSALIIASVHNQLGCARILAPRSSFGARDLSGRTALAHACIAGFEPMALLLISLADLERDRSAIVEGMALARATQHAPLAASLQLWLDSQALAKALALEIADPATGSSDSGKRL